MPAAAMMLSCSLIHSGSARRVRWPAGSSRPPPMSEMSAAQRFHAPMLARSDSASPCRYSPKFSPQFGKMTCWSRPQPSRASRRAAGSRYVAGISV